MPHPRHDPLRARAARCGARTRGVGNRLAARHGERRDAERRRPRRPAARLGPDAALREQVLVRNPAKLYGF